MKRRNHNILDAKQVLALMAGGIRSNARCQGCWELDLSLWPLQERLQRVGGKVPMMCGTCRHEGLAYKGSHNGVTYKDKRFRAWRPDEVAQVLGISLDRVYSLCRVHG